MMWSRIVPEVYSFARLDRPPDVLVLHVGENDLGVRSIRKLIKDVKFDYLRLRMAFPDMLVLWSNIAARTTWRLARSGDRINKACIKVNKMVGRFVIRNGGLVICQRDTGLYLRRDSGTGSQG